LSQGESFDAQSVVRFAPSLAIALLSASQRSGYLTSMVGLDKHWLAAHDMAPLFHVRPDAPPMLFITGDRNLEMLGRYF
jgi:hypothetical protein